jgi:hypothetical protein
MHDEVRRGTLRAILRLIRLDIDGFLRLLD